MRTRKSIERLAAAGRPLLADADSLVDAHGQERILERIVASDRSPVRRRRPIAIALVAAAAIGAAAVAAVVMHGHAAPPPTAAGGHHRLALTGARIETAGYHFRTPAGFIASDTSCDAPSKSGPSGISKPGRLPDVHGFSAAASADGGCVEAFFLIPGSPAAQTPNPPPGQSVSVGSSQGYYDPQGSDGGNLYIELPKADPAAPAPVFLVLYAQGLTEAQLIAVAESGFDFSPTTTTGTEGS